MNKKIYYFVRHGQSLANSEGVFAGQKENSPLTKKGREQAVEAAHDIIRKRIRIDKVYSSPLLRAKETAEIIIKEANLGIEIIIDDRISEYDMGSLTGTPIRKVSSRELISAKNAEDVISFSDRVHNILDELLGDKENILLVSHAGVGRIIEAKRIGISPHTFYDLNPYPNAQVVKIVHKKK